MGILCEAYNITEDYNVQELNEIFYNLEEWLNANSNVWVNDMWTDSTYQTIIVAIDRGDWKHDHLRLNQELHQWAQENNIRISIEEEVTEDDGSDTYSSNHIIHLFDSRPIELKLKEGFEDMTSDEAIQNFLGQCTEKLNQSNGEQTDAELEIPKALDTDEFFYDLEEACYDSGIGYSILESNEFPDGSGVYMYIKIYTRD